MTLNIPPQKWRALCQYAATHPTCKLVLHQHEGVIKRITIEQELQEEDASQATLRFPLDNNVECCTQS